MPFFERKKQRFDVTRHWVGDTRFPLELDLSANTLSGVRIGGSLDGFMRLGPAEDREAAEQEVYRYYSRGLEITADEGFVTAFRILFAGSEGFQPFPGRCSYSAQPVALSASTTEADLRGVFGEPYWRDRDDEEILLFHEFPPIEWQIELNQGGALAQWTLLSPPSMQDPEQRRAYGVTRPWPPAGADRIRPRSAAAFPRRG